MGRAARKIPPRARPTSEIDLEPFRNAVNDAATRVRGLWLGYIALLAYLFIAVGAVTHRDLLLQNPVRLPVLNVELPLVGFFVVAPAFFLINHFYLLLQLFGLGQRIKSFNDEIETSGFNEATLKRQMLRLDTFVIVQLLAGSTADRDKLMCMFLSTIAIITIVFAPIALLLTIQLQFLPYQDQVLTWWHRIAVSVDLILIWIFWPSIRLGEWASWRNTLLQTAAGVFILFFTCAVATFPGEFVDGGMKSEAWKRHDDSYFATLKGGLFGELAWGKRRERYSPFSRAIDLSDNSTLIDLDNFDKIRKRHKDNNEPLEAWQTGRTLDLRTRNLRGAMFDRSDLRNVDFFEADLRGASLEHARLQGTSLASASLQRVSFNNANVQEVSFRDAYLQEATLQRADLQNALLANANLQNASFANANLTGASLHNSELQGVSFRGAKLLDASLEYSKLQQTVLELVDLRRASLEHAELQEASLLGVQLQGASLQRANLKGTFFRIVNLQGASLARANLQGAFLLNVQLQGASLQGASLQGATFRGGKLNGASLASAKLQGALLSGTNLQVASLANASLQGVSLSAINLRGATLDKTYLWRTSGKIDRSDLEGVWVNRPRIEPLDMSKIEALVREVQDGFVSETARRKIKQNMAQLSVSKERLRHSLTPEYWAQLESKLSESEHRKYLANYLKVLACDESGAPYVAQGLVAPVGTAVKGIKTRLEDAGPPYLHDLARTLLDAVEEKTGDCSGAKGLNTAAIANLRKWVTQVR